MAVLVLWAIYIAVSIYGCTMIEIDFKLTYFISPEAYINDYLSRSDKYFKAGDEI